MMKINPHYLYLAISQSKSRYGPKYASRYGPKYFYRYFSRYKYWSKSGSGSGNFYGYRSESWYRKSNLTDK